MSALIQGTPEWHAHRNTHDNASEAASMLGVKGAYISRRKLVQQKATGVEPDIDPYQQQRFDDGHKHENAARKMAEDIIGEELYPQTVSKEIEGLKLSASLDGLTMMNDVTWEHKLLNKQNGPPMDQGVIPDVYKPQMEQGLLLTGASKCLFMVSKDGDRESMRYAWYESDPALRAALIPGWKQFHEDVDAFDITLIEDSKPAPVGRTLDSLPQLYVEVRGEVTASNIDEWKQATVELVEQMIIDPETDEDFATAEKEQKWVGTARKKISSLKDQVMTDSAAIGELVDVLDFMDALLREKKGIQAKAIKAKKESLKARSVNAADVAFKDYIQKINAALEPVRLPAIVPNWAVVIKGKKLISSIEDALDAELARCKILANEHRLSIESNLKKFKVATADHAALFHDMQALVLKPEDDMLAAITARIAVFEAEQAAKAAREAEAAEKAARAAQEEEDRRIAAAAQKRRDDAEKAEAAKRVFAQPSAPPEEPAAAQPVNTVVEIDHPAKTRPTDQEIIAVLSNHYRVHEWKVIDWLMGMDLETAHKQIEV